MTNQQAAPKGATDRLNPVEAWVVRQRHGFRAPRPYSELRRDSGLSIRRIRQVERAALAKLRSLSGSSPRTCPNAED